MSAQTNGGALWPESAGSGVASAISGLVIGADGADWALRSGGAEAAVFADLDGTGTYVLTAIGAAAGKARLHIAQIGALALFHG